MPPYKPTKPAETLTVLQAVRALLSVPEHWTKGAFSRDKTGRPADPVCAKGTETAWCLAGAIYRVSESFEWAASASERAIMNANKVNTIRSFNDAPDTTHADILALLDKTIAALTPTAKPLP